MKRIAWRGVNNQSAWFHHPRAFWSTVRYPLGFRRHWFLAVHDPIYVGLWVVLLIGATIGAVL